MIQEKKVVYQEKCFKEISKKNILCRSATANGRRQKLSVKEFKALTSDINKSIKEKISVIPKIFFPAYQKSAAIRRIA